MKLKNGDRTCGWKWVKKMYYVWMTLKISWDHDACWVATLPQLLKVAKSHTYFTENHPVNSQYWCLRLILEEV